MTIATQAQEFWQIDVAPEQMGQIFQAALKNSARGLSEMVGRPINIHTPHVEAVPIHKVADHVGGPEAEMVGIYLVMEGDLPGQVILMLTLSEAFYLVDLLLGEPPGTTTELGELESSALAETGNLTASFFINEVAKLTGTTSRPSPPAVMVDMLGAIVNVIALPLATFTDTLPIVETIFEESDRIVRAHFWVLPSPA
ncbi:MAG TPA: chemotaxis protein CheC [Anaerolineae bacterium]|nr:chemotaxis protein CheC [Anaerolineae bacterium]HMR67907.1 chemotaxis protein CheC [Anaerolineae bacterium]